MLESNNKCCIGILKWLLIWDKQKMQTRHFIWDRGSENRHHFVWLSVYLPLFLRPNTTMFIVYTYIITLSNKKFCKLRELFAAVDFLRILNYLEFSNSSSKHTLKFSTHTYNDQYTLIFSLVILILEINSLFGCWPINVYSLSAKYTSWNNFFFIIDCYTNIT